MLLTFGSTIWIYTFFNQPPSKFTCGIVIFLRFANINGVTTSFAVLKPAWEIDNPAPGSVYSNVAYENPIRPTRAFVTEYIFNTQI